MKKLALIILDGFGINNTSNNQNAIHLSQSPNFDKLFAGHYSTLEASGKAVGIFEGHIGNSEVGHMTIGSGRIIKQYINRIDDMFNDGSFEKLDKYQAMIDHCTQNRSNIHILQIFGPGGVHGYDQHLKKLLKIIPSNIEVNLHLFGDGRDLEPKSMLNLMEEFSTFLEDYDNVHISSLSGRYYAMDRDNNWDRIQKAYDEILFGIKQTSDSPCEYISKSYLNNLTDEFLEPISFVEGDKIESGDAVIFLNFRSDRARQMTQALRHSMHLEKGNTQFNFITKNLKNIYMLTMTKYYPEYSGDVLIEDTHIDNTLGEVIANNELRQLHIAETEKFAHVTKFFNGGQQIVYDGEKDILIPSHKVATYDLDPAMSAEEIYDKFVSHANDFDFVLINFANSDMVGHTGNMEATIQAIEILDKIIGNIINFCKKNNFELIISADHGNCEEMGTIENPKTSHTTNDVPCRYISQGETQKLKDKGGLSDIAPTILSIMGISQPKQMTGKSLLIQ